MLRIDKRLVRRFLKESKCADVDIDQVLHLLGGSGVAGYTFSSVGPTLDRDFLWRCNFFVFALNMFLCAADMPFLAMIV